MSNWAVFLGVYLAALPLCAGDIAGLVRIERKLTKPKVTAPTSSYQRGAAVELGSDSVDPLVWERLRVVIYVDGQLPTKPATALIEQKNRRFVPETLVVPIGSTVSFPNLDPIFHNVFSLSKVKSFDLGNYARNQTRSVSFTKPGIVFVHCHLHPNMAAAIVVSPNAWSTQPDGVGRYELADVPAGKHKVIAWHKAAGFFEQTIDVPASGRTLVDFAIPIPAESNVAQR
jgi:plastocyanin